MSMRAIWTDPDGDSIELTSRDALGSECEQNLWLMVNDEDEAVFTFDAIDARTLGEYLISWADRQEGR